MPNPFHGRDIISVKDISKQDFDYLFASADLIETMTQESRERIARGRLLATMFYEPSTRTRLSFEAAMYAIGGNTLGFAEATSTSVEKGENLADTVRVVAGYVDIVVLRHPREGAARFAAEMTEKPVINAGSGSEEHPTQAMLDLYTIIKEKGTIDNLGIAVVGDLRYGRAVYSLLHGLARYSPRVFLVSPPELKVRDEILFDLEGKIKLSQHLALDEVIAESDVIYVTRIQKERFPDPQEYDRVKGSYIIDNALLDRGKRDAIVMHPLPRVTEIKPEVDRTPKAKYFAQAQRGKTLRSALIGLILNPELQR